MTLGRLTPQQRKVFAFIEAQLKLGRSPSVREIAEAIGARQHSSARRHVDALLAKGLLTREPGVHRGLRVRRAVDDGPQP